jgi:hypothetical protein
MGRASRIKREKRADPDRLTVEERRVFNALCALFEKEHGRRPVSGDILFDDGAGTIWTAGGNLPEPRY